MPPVKKRVGPFVREHGSSGSYRYVNKQSVGRNGEQMVYTVELSRESGGWALLAGLYADGFESGRKPEQVREVERLGAPQAHADDFDTAKRWAYRYMRSFSGSPSYNGMVDLASEAGWVHRMHGPY